MLINRVVTTVRDVRSFADFARQTLELSVTDAPDRASVRVGSSVVEVRQDSHVEGNLHLAFAIPPGAFDSAKRWLAERVVLLTDDGDDEVEASKTWNARSAYFEAPDGTVLELIMRRDLDAPPKEDFTTADIISISEVGVSVPSVWSAVETLEAADLRLYGQERPGEEFAPVGDVNGLLILVADGRTWFPTADRVARSRPVLIEARGGRPGEYPLTDEARLTIGGSDDPCC